MKVTRGNFIMKKDKRLIVRLIGVLSIVATTSMATPAYAMSADVLKGHSEVQSMSQYQGKTTTQSTQDYINKSVSSKDGSRVAVTSGAVQQSLVYGWNAISNDPNKICYVKDGIKQTGWVQAGGWRYFDQGTGFMLREQWKQDNGVWYYLKADGSMAFNVNVDSYHVDKSGAWDSNAISGAPTYTKVGVYDSDGKGGSDLARQDFQSMVSSGQIKARVDYYGGLGSSDVANAGTLRFYLAN